ncbi:MAG: DnaA/Hda family protein [Gemmatimonadales bacterium]
MIEQSLTFKSFVVGTENRLAWQAARTAAETPGSAYNPLFIYSTTGLGKTHLLSAIVNRLRDLRSGLRAIYAPLDDLLRELGNPAESDIDYKAADILLIDDLQFIDRHPEGQRLLFQIIDQLLRTGKQVVIASDRPPLELGELDDRLLSRFSGGLVVDIGRPMLDTRRAILDRQLTMLGEDLRPEVIDAVARLAIDNVRQLKGALLRVLAEQQAQDREIEADEVDKLLSDVVTELDLPWLGDERKLGEFQEFVSNVSTAVEDALGSPKWREDLARAILKWEGEGYVTKRLETFLDRDEPVDPEQVISAYERDIARLKIYAHELERLGVSSPDDIALRDPERIEEMREIVQEARRETIPIDDFFFDAEKVVWTWPVIEEQLIEGWENGNQG